MKVAKRRHDMLEAVHAGITSIEALCRHFGISEATARRDLGALSDQGLLVRTYCGAAAHIGHREPELTLEQRRTRQGDVKARLADCALGCIEDNDTVLLDGGTTTAALAARLGERRGLHVVTNNLAALPWLTQLPEGHTTVLGGDLRASSMTAYGPLAHAALSRLTVDRLFLSADGVTELGLCEASPEQAWLKEAMISRAAEVYVMADATKLGRASQQHWTPFPHQWTLITDASDERLESFRALGATVRHPAATET
ncbi:DeoR/GlpR family DNA-binding transcription regulator [Salinicola socius]|uniref:DeoR family transcriptional regulator n=1 Tax=Salinicola socius TaxID=404433 RepID=A0A1Q8SUV9_9GAMM|nr:DeoR/GlpR family DNA-binding transcription regulator [Salinicola socius]OLO05187.1 DeoR family transcriptional regulator [Salinicola socius]